MSIEAINAVRKMNIRPCGRKFVAMALADYADETGRCYPSIKTLAAYTSQGPRTVQTHLEALERMGFLTRERSRNSRGQLGQYRYRIDYRQISPLAKIANGVKLQNPPANFAGHNHQTLPLTGNDSPERGGAKVALPPEFQKFEEIYRRQAGANFGSREKAIQAFRETCESGVSPIRLIEGAKGWARDREKQGERATFATSAARFLSEGSWRTYEPRWPDYWARIAQADRGDDSRDGWVSAWRKTFGGPLPGEPGSLFPPELIPDAVTGAAA